MGKYDERPYEVGKGKPPAKYRFAKGTSGNPKGPKHKKKLKDASLAVLVQQAANELISVTVNGIEHKLPKKYAIILALINDALKGTPNQRLKAFNALKENGGYERIVEDDRRTPEQQQQAIAEFVAVLAKEAEREMAASAEFEQYLKQ